MCFCLNTKGPVVSVCVFIQHTHSPANDDALWFGSSAFLCSLPATFNPTRALGEREFENNDSVLTCSTEDRSVAYQFNDHRGLS